MLILLLFRRLNIFSSWWFKLESTKKNRMKMSQVTSKRNPSALTQRHGSNWDISICCLKSTEKVTRVVSVKSLTETKNKITFSFISLPNVLQNSGREPLAKYYISLWIGFGLLPLQSISMVSKVVFFGIRVGCNINLNTK